MKLDHNLRAKDLAPAIERLFSLSEQKIHSLQDTWDPTRGTPVFTVKGRYTTRGWTEWTQGFQYGSVILQFDATGDESLLELGRRLTLDHMDTHLTHTGVHDHGFNNVSTYGNLRRLALEGRYNVSPWEMRLYELALKVSAAVQASRWTLTHDTTGYIYSFNGPQSLFVDTIRTLRILALGHALGHSLMGEGDRQTSLLSRLVEHAVNTTRYNIYFGEGRDAYDIRGRVAHEAVFNTNDGQFRCPNSQQGYSPFSTWTRGLAWAITGYAEQLEFLIDVPEADFPDAFPKAEVLSLFVKTAKATADFYIEHTAADGIPYWDTGAPGLNQLGDYRSKPADPYNDWEPVDSSAAAIAAQGLLRLARLLTSQQDAGAERYATAGLTVARALCQEPYLSTDPQHQGLLLHSVYHRPNGWDYIPPGSRIPHSESSMWGDYHLRELALYLKREIEGGPYFTFFGPRSS
jgi:unsaturated chondroitin disaccharide hydrolase